jgi:hypothetical protein
MAEANKTVRCENGHIFDVPIKTTITQCPICDVYVVTAYTGVTVDANGNYVY